MADSRIAYGLAKKNGIDTKGMTPKEVWDALKKKGINRESFDKKNEKQLNDAVNIYSDDPETDRKEMRESGTLPAPKNTFKSPTAQEFHSALKEAKESNLEENRWRVDLHSAVDYENARRFTTEGGSCVAIEPNGNIISVCKNQNGNDRGSELIQKAVREGGNRLDAFGDDLYNFYTKNGFEPVSYTNFSRDAAPPDWKEEFEEEPVIFYKYTGKRTKLTYQEFIDDKSHCFDGENGYNDAEKFRDENMKQKSKG